MRASTRSPSQSVAALASLYAFSCSMCAAGEHEPPAAILFAMLGLLLGILGSPADDATLT